MVDRTLIEVRLRDGWTLRAIARVLDRSLGTVSDEVARQGDRAGHAACAAQAQAASARSRCGRTPRLGAGDALFAEVADLRHPGWSPAQIAGRRRRIEDSAEQQGGVAISHEAIYAALYAALHALPRGALRPALIACPRQVRPARGRTSPFMRLAAANAAASCAT